MKAIYFDCFSGASGDMILGALVASGLDAKALKAKLSFIKGFKLKTKKVMRGPIAAVSADVIVRKGGCREVVFDDIVRMVRRSKLEADIQKDIIRIFERLAAAEARIHGISRDRVHFHEVGAVDAMVDICGAVVGLRMLGIEKVFVSTFPLSRGTMQCSHGTLPVPAPAVLELIKEFRATGSDATIETLTPTGAAILTTLAERKDGKFPEMTMLASGYGAGKADLPGMPNALRAMIGELTEAGAGTADRVWLVETNLDDATGEEVGHLVGELFKAGALDAWVQHIYMKKNRPAFRVSAIVGQDKAGAVERCFLIKSSTFGVRKVMAERTKLSRSVSSVRIASGEVVRVKAGRLAPGRKYSIKKKAEYDDLSTY